jgi:hypothetical protein
MVRGAEIARIGRSCSVFVDQRAFPDEKGPCAADMELFWMKKTNARRSLNILGQKRSVRGKHGAFSGGNDVCAANTGDFRPEQGEHPP